MFLRCIFTGVFTYIIPLVARSVFVSCSLLRIYPDHGARSVITKTVMSHRKQVSNEHTTSDPSDPFPSVTNIKQNKNNNDNNDNVVVILAVWEGQVKAQGA